MSIYKYMLCAPIIREIDIKLEHIHGRNLVQYCTYQDYMVYNNHIYNITLSKIRLFGPYVYTMRDDPTYNLIRKYPICKHYINTY